MKKKFRVGGIVFVFLLLVCVQVANRRKPENRLFLNIEALANGESGSLDCYYTGSVDCPANHVKVYMVIS